MNKDKQIEEFLNEPIKIGDRVEVKGLGIQNKSSWGRTTEVVRLGDSGNVFIEEYGREKEVKVGDYRKDTDHIGYDPMAKKPWNSNLQILNFGLESVLFSVGYDRRKSRFMTEKYGDVEVEELNWNPFIIDKDGNEVKYQRDFVWTLEDKQLLIESIYNYIDIGKIVLRKRSFKWVEKRVKEGKEANFKDVVDGKQRLNAILEFVQNKFPDKNGNYWKDFSEYSQRQFMGFQSLGYGELGENATDEDVKSVFLGINFTGAPMSQEHIEFVKNINL